MNASSALWPVLAFVLVLVAIPLALWLMRRAGVGSAGPGNLLRAVAGLPLSPTQKVVVVELGTGGQAHWLVLGVGQDHVTPLLTLDAPPGSAALLNSPQGPAVQQLLNRFRQGGQGTAP
ncbi:flagellar biosynthetic protein FliO [Ideonella sp. 4Y11]|uniref:Flagellar biosynthetic protein FliO n=1 Tax=Ideonella aquatica TaxID=2824119 RepID=A0A940YHZ6_9BURK|nr:flagellar biosynthetic protein FliO [Ideonella aquatica]MBQ0958461.1 flagellar biosynthetic protein FliO [Ideonella aquatica]